MSFRNFVTMGFQRILVGIDESELGQQVFTQVLDLAKIHQAQIHLLHTLQDPGQFMGSVPSLSGFPDMGTYPVFSDPSFWETQVQSQKERARHWIEHYGVQAQQAGVVAGWSCQVGEAGPALCEMAKQHQADLIVIGRRGLSGLAEVLAGSVSNYVVHHAPCSVLVVQASNDSGVGAS
jgi:nucleotide-binding universal stress UspA family protein